MSDSELLLKPVAELAVLISSRELSPVELAAATIRQIDRTQPVLNAYLERFTGEFTASARRAEQEIRSGDYRGPLHGIPVGLKDLVDARGHVTTGGSIALKAPPATADATVTRRLREAGALITGKLNMVEFAFGFSSVNPHTGDVKNPWNTERVAAGSSSGSAAAVAAGAAAMAIGSDTGGSVRMPAAACGITGLKPTYGVVSRTGVLDLSWSSDHVGPMCRTAIDCALMMNAIAGHDPLDPASSSRKMPDFTSELERGPGGIRIGVPADYFFDGVDPEISAAVMEAVNVLQSAGAVVSEIAMPWVSLGRAVNVAVLLPEAAAVHESLLAERGDLYSPAVRHRLEAGLRISAVDYIHAQRARAKFGHQMADAMRDVDVLITPTVPIQTPTLAETTPPEGSPFPPAGGEFPNFTGVFNATGQPSLSLNCGFTSDGMPVGMMISGKAFCDAQVLGIAHAYQRVTGWAGRTPPVCG
ncbi:MAG: amidase [Chloroflexi bacterium]|nr:amidase [Chloroflexota bacterium]